MLTVGFCRFVHATIAVRKGRRKANRLRVRGWVVVVGCRLCLLKVVVMTMVGTSREYEPMCKRYVHTYIYTYVYR